MNIDASQLRAFGDSLITGTPARRARISKAVRKGAQYVKTAITEDLHGSSYPQFRRIPIHYEIQTAGIAGIAADISPGDGDAGDLANIAFFGTARGGGTHRFYGHAEDELPKLAEYVREAADDI